MKKTSLSEGWLFGEKGKEGEPVSLPHDAMQRQGRKSDAPSGTGGAFFLGGNYIYEKELWAPQEWKDQDIILEFEGVYPSAAVFLNGIRIGGCQYGYSLFRVPLTGLHYNEKNRIRVEVDHSSLPDTRWYSGAGIYRPVWLLEGKKEHINPDGIRVTTLSWEPAQICVEVDHTQKGDVGTEVRIEIFYQGKKIASSKGEKADICIPDARLWDAESPNLYECRATLNNGEEILDVQSAQFGIRKIDWSSQGLTVNGKNVLLKGGCIHHDNGILGARTYDKTEWRRIRRLKEFGFNAIRSAHNPLCRAALEACDALGMYVMDEAWDMWDISKTAHDYAGRFQEHYEFDLSSMVGKDYNHPSVIMYSIGNEVTEPAKQAGIDLAGKIIAKLKGLDQTRPVTAGINLTLLLMSTMEHNPLADGAGAVPDTLNMNSTAYNKMVSEFGNKMTLGAATEEADRVSSPVLDRLDIAGYNYAVSRYEKEGGVHPGRIVVGSETYPYELARTWKLVERIPYVIGDFMWTAWDYIGEAGIGAWSYDPEDMGFGKNYPWLLADTGALDILGNDNGEAGLAAVVWGKRTTPYIGVCPVNHPGTVPSHAIWRGSNALPYWSYQGCEGNEAEVEVYSTADWAELFVNGRSAGRKELQDCKAVFHTVYEPGELKAVASNADGTFHSESSLFSADEDLNIRISPEENDVGAGELLYLDISLTGANGQVECNRDTSLRVTVEGGELLAFGSANPKTEEDFLSGVHTTYYGRSLAVVKVQPGQVTVRVSGDSLPDAVKIIQVEETGNCRE